jgi:hypothetical protein
LDKHRTFLIESTHEKEKYFPLNSTQQQISINELMKNNYSQSSSNKNNDNNIIKQV